MDNELDLAAKRRGCAVVKSNHGHDFLSGGAQAHPGDEAGIQSKPRAGCETKDVPLRRCDIESNARPLAPIPDGDTLLHHVERGGPLGRLRARLTTARSIGHTRESGAFKSRDGKRRKRYRHGRPFSKAEES